MRHDFEEKLNVVREIVIGKGIKTVCRERHLDRHMVYGWLLSYKAYGDAGLRESPVSCRYSTAEKEMIVLEHVRNDVPLSQLSLRYGVSRCTVKSWLRKYRSGGTFHEVKQSVQPPRAMARPKKKNPQTELEKLQEENLRLRAENALLKKVKALVEKEKAQTRLNGQESSTN